MGPYIIPRLTVLSRDNDPCRIVGIVRLGQADGRGRSVPSLPRRTIQFSKSKSGLVQRPHPKPPGMNLISSPQRPKSAPTYA